MNGERLREGLGLVSGKPVETKYATIDRDTLKQLQADSEELARLKAQPASQVGGDEREAFEAWMISVEGSRIRTQFDKATEGPFSGEYRDGRMQGAWNVWQARAALAPEGDGVNWKAVAREQMGVIEGLQARIAALAPAAVVMPEKMGMIGVADLGTAALNTQAKGWNAALDEVARLNAQTVTAAELEALRKAFTVSESGGGQYRVVMKFETLADMQEGHTALVRMMSIAQQQEGGSHE